MRYLFTSKADAEISAVAVYYERRRPGLGRRFLEAVEAAVRDIAASPRRWSRLNGVRSPDEMRIYSLTGFPYVVIYCESHGEIVVHAVSHAARLK